MLSVLIPVFNFDIRKLADILVKQCTEAEITFEIICLDDGSNQIFKNQNADLKNMDWVHYVELEKNIGRSAIRNKLATIAKYEHLLFIDCDSEIISDSYIKNYITIIDTYEVVYGGRAYTKNPPSEPSKFLRWKYGSEREQVSAAKRKENSYLFFLTNNFLIRKNIFEKVRLNESLKGYGHEDTLMAYEMKRQKINILHIDNPLCHIGLETTDDFMKKTAEGIKNLLFLMKHYPFAVEEVKLVNIYRWIKLPLINSLADFFLFIIEKKIIKNLNSINPNLYYFDLYKLRLLILSH